MVNAAGRRDAAHNWRLGIVVMIPAPAPERLRGSSRAAGTAPRTRQDYGGKPGRQHPEAGPTLERQSGRATSSRLYTLPATCAPMSIPMP